MVQRATKNDDDLDQQNNNNMSDEEEAFTRDNESDEEEEEALPTTISDEQLEILTQKLAANMYDYGTHVSLIQAYRQRSQYTELRKARETMLQIFPLNENQWYQWLQDECAMIESEEDREAIEYVKNLYRTALGESEMMPRVWKSFLSFCEQFESDESVLAQVLEQCVNSVGYHMRQGCVFWDLYRDFVKDSDESVRALWKRQLSIPHLQFKQTKRAYEEWESDKVKQKELLSDPCVVQTISLLKQRKKLEKWIRNTPKDGAPSKNLLNHWLNYIQFEKKQFLINSTNEETKHLGIQYMICFFERIVKECCLSDTLWIEYLKFLESRGSECINKLIPLCHRATRNCMWNSSLWVAYITFLEYSYQGVDQGIDLAYNQIYSIYSRAMQSGQMATCNDYVQVIAAYCSFMRRRYQQLIAPTETTDQKKTELREELRNLFDTSVSYIYDYFPSTPDKVCILERMWASAEATLFDNMDKAREIFAYVTQAYGSSEPTLWLNYAQFEQTHSKDFNLVHQIYYQAFLRLENPRAKRLIASYWLHTEREHGSIGTLLFAEQITRDLMAHGSHKSEDEGQKERTVPESKPLKRPTSQTNHITQPVVEAKDENDKPSNTRDVDSQSMHDTKQKSNKRDRSEYEANEQKETATSSDRKSKTQNKLQLRGPGNEQLTLFILNLAYNVDENALGQLFEQHNCHVEDVRIMRDRRGASKGIGFVEMKDEKSVTEGLKLHGTELQKRVIKVERSDPEKGKKNQGSSNQSIDSERPAKKARTSHEPAKKSGLMIPRAALFNKPSAKVTKNTHSVVQQSAPVQQEQSEQKGEMSNEDFRSMLGM